MTDETKMRRLFHALPWLASNGKLVDLPTFPIR